MQELRANEIWNLICIAYSDGQISAEEKGAIEYVAQKWDFDKAMLAEMKDTADTIAILDNKKEWLKTLKMSYDEINKEIKAIDKQIEKLMEAVKITVSEADLIEEVPESKPRSPKLISMDE